MDGSKPEVHPYRKSTEKRPRTPPRPLPNSPIRKKSRDSEVEFSTAVFNIVICGFSSKSTITVCSKVLIYYIILKQSFSDTFVCIFCTIILKYFKMQIIIIFKDMFRRALVTTKCAKHISAVSVKILCYRHVNIWSTLSDIARCHQILSNIYWYRANIININVDINIINICTY